jgi:uncharacterized protein
MNARLRLCLALLLTMTACTGSPDIRYYTLSAETAPTRMVTAIRAGRGVYAIDAVVIPDVLDRPQIVLRSGANAVEVLDYDRWAGSLPDQLQRVFAADLSARLGVGAIADPGLPAIPQAGRIAISILAFGPERHGESVIEASWAISDKGSGPAGGITKTYRARHAAANKGSDVPALVATMSDAVAMIADDIAATLASED